MILLAADAGAVSGALGFLVLVLLGVACVLLYRSMGRHLRRVPPSFDRTKSRPPTGNDER